MPDSEAGSVNAMRVFDVVTLRVTVENLVVGREVRLRVLEFTFVVGREEGDLVAGGVTPFMLGKLRVREGDRVRVKDTVTERVRVARMDTTVLETDTVTERVRVARMDTTVRDTDTVAVITPPIGRVAVTRLVVGRGERDLLMRAVTTVRDTDTVAVITPPIGRVKVARCVVGKGERDLVMRADITVRVRETDRVRVTDIVLQAVELLEEVVQEEEEAVGADCTLREKLASKV